MNYIIFHTVWQISFTDIYHLGKVPKTPRGGVPLIWGGATNFGQKWGDNTFCPGMGGHEILTWNGGGSRKISSVLLFFLGGDMKFI